MLRQTQRHQKYEPAAERFANAKSFIMFTLFRDY